MSRLREEGWALPGQLVGTSAGAAMATACLTTRPDVALEACKAIFSQTPSSFNWSMLLRGRLQFSHLTVYPAWLDTFVNESTFAEMQVSGSTLQVAVTRPGRLLGLGVSVTLGTLAYLLDNKIRPSIHPRLPGYLGLRLEFIDITRCRNAAEARSVLSAAAAPPPVMPAVKLQGRYAFDGGYTDNAPIPDQTLSQRQSTLVLLTRHYPYLPALFRFRQRLYWQPTRPVPVSTWDCTHKATVEDAYRLGRADAGRAMLAER